MAQIRAVLALLFLQHCLTAAEECDTTKIRPCITDYQKVVQTLKWSPEAQGYAGACGTPGMKDECDMCPAVKKWEQCWDKAAVGCHQAITAQSFPDRRTPALTWEQICDPPCKNIGKYQACQSKFIASQYKKYTVRDFDCGEYMEFKECAKSELATCREEVKPSMTMSFEQLTSPAAASCEPRCKEYFQGQIKCMKERDEALKALTEAHQKACMTGEGECKACPFFAQFFECESKLPRCSHAKLAEQASKDISMLNSQSASMCPDTFIKPTILL